jgi:hypothetical protein
MELKDLQTDLQALTNTLRELIDQLNGPAYPPNDEADALWLKAQTWLRHRMPRDTYLAHVAPTTATRAPDGRFILLARTEGSAFWLRERYAHLIVRALQAQGATGTLSIIVRKEARDA